MSKTYALLNGGYSHQLLVPIELLPMLVEKSYMVTTTYSNGKNSLDSIKPIDTVSLYSADDVNIALAQAALEND